MPNKFMYKSFLRVFTGNSVVQCSNLVVASILITYIGLEWYGTFIIYQSYFYVLIALSRPNTSLSCVKFEVGNGNERKLYVSTSLDLMSPLIFLMLSPLLIAYFTNINYFDLGIIIFASYFVSNGTLLGVTRSAGRFGFITNIQIISSLLKVIFSYFFAAFFYSETLTPLNFFSGILFIDCIVWLLGYILYIGILTPLICISKFYSTFQDNMDFIKFSFWGMLQSIIDLPVTQLDRLILSSTLGADAVGVYNLIKRIGSIVNQIVEPISVVMFPNFVSMLACGNYTAIIKTAKKTMFIVAVITIPISAFVYLFFPFFDKLLFASSLIEYKELVILYILIQSLSLCFAWMNPLSNALGLMKENTIVLILANTVFTFNLILLSEWWGVLGAVVAILSQYIVFYLLKSFIIKSKWKLYENS